jgi:hypothetical protein
MKNIKTESMCFDAIVDSERNKQTPKGFVAVNLVNHANEVIEVEMSAKQLRVFVLQFKKEEKAKQ